ncbi:unnamed protein product [Colias eurytheme]|nr:unnamed protein product [Colias eurytheme]
MTYKPCDPDALNRCDLMIRQPVPRPSYVSWHGLSSHKKSLREIEARIIAQHLLLKTCPKKVHGRALTPPPAAPQPAPLAASPPTLPHPPPSALSPRAHVIQPLLPVSIYIVHIIRIILPMTFSLIGEICCC